MAMLSFILISPRDHLMHTLESIFFFFLRTKCVMSHKIKLIQKNSRVENSWKGYNGMTDKHVETLYGERHEKYEHQRRGSL